MVSLFIVGISGYRAISKMSDELDIAYNQRVKLATELGNIEAAVHASGRWIWMARAFENDPKERGHYIEESKNEIKNTDKAIAEYAPIRKALKAQELLDKVLIPDWMIAKKVYEEIISIIERNDAKTQAESKALITGKLHSSLLSVNKAIDEIQVAASANNEKIMNKALDYAHSAKQVAVIVVLIAAILCFVICIRIANQLVKILSTLSGELNNSSYQVSSAVEQIAASSEQLSQATIEQVSSLEETSSSIQEMSSMVTKTSENAAQASKVSAEGQQNALKGQEVVKNMIAAITDITESNKNIMIQIDQSNREISEIVKVIAEIGNKTKVINDIVFQTKLLSFNASVEAARAGEQGKGFAVVAEEVGNLAAMSGKAASEITEMLDVSIHKVEGIVNDTKTKVERLVNEGKLKVDIGTKIARQCGDVLEEIVASISSISEMAKEIAVSSHEQSQGVSEITRAMNQINVATQQNSSSATQSASAAEELSAQVNVLKNAVQSLMVTIEG